MNEPPDEWTCGTNGCTKEGVVFTPLGNWSCDKHGVEAMQAWLTLRTAPSEAEPPRDDVERLTPAHEQLLRRYAPGAFAAPPVAAPAPAQPDESK